MTLPLPDEKTEEEANLSRPSRTTSFVLAFVPHVGKVVDASGAPVADATAVRLTDRADLAAHVAPGDLRSATGAVLDAAGLPIKGAKVRVVHWNAAGVGTDGGTVAPGGQGLGEVVDPGTARRGSLRQAPDDRLGLVRGHRGFDAVEDARRRIPLYVERTAERA